MKCILSLSSAYVPNMCSDDSAYNNGSFKTYEEKDSYKSVIRNDCTFFFTKMYNYFECKCGSLKNICETFTFLKQIYGKNCTF